jgi:hypothetical protein
MVYICRDIKSDINFRHVLLSPVRALDGMNTGPIYAML